MTRHYGIPGKLVERREAKEASVFTVVAFGLAAFAGALGLFLLFAWNVPGV